MEEDVGLEDGLSEQEGAEGESEAEREDGAAGDSGDGGGEDVSLFITCLLFTLPDFTSLMSDSLLTVQGFFEEAPLPLSDVNFTDMNLSRPLLKVVICIHVHVNCMLYITTAYYLKIFFARL